MPRLLPDPQFTISELEWLTGPNARNSGSTTAMDGSEQTFSSYGDGVAFRVTLRIAQGVLARRQRGYLTALPGGNAFRFKYIDGDIMKPVEAGIVGPYGSQAWSNGEPWSNGLGWAPSYPVVPVTASAAFDMGIVKLSDAYWGHRLGMGDHIGFMPFHFGLYTVTEVIDDGEYRIWPRLRKALTTDDFCTLHPTLVVKPMNRESATWTRNPSYQEGASLSLVEVHDYYVRDYYEG